MRPLLNMQRLKTGFLWRMFYNGKAIHIHWLFSRYCWQFNSARHNSRIYDTNRAIDGRACDGYLGGHCQSIA